MDMQKDNAMNKQVKDIRGQRFGKLTIKKYIQAPGKSSLWLAECDCGVEIEITRKKLMKGKRSCGCLVSLPKLKNIEAKIKKANKGLTTKGIVYIAKAKGTLFDMVGPVYKVGYTNSLNTRIKNLSNEYDLDFSLVLYAESFLARELEWSLHQVLKEWYAPIRRKSGSLSREFFHIANLNDIKAYFESLGAEVYI